MFTKLMCKVFPDYAKLVRLNECLIELKKDYEIALKYNDVNELSITKAILSKLEYINTGKKN